MARAGHGDGDAAAAPPPPPGQFLNLEELEGLAARKLPAMAMGYYASGAESQQGVADNRAAYARYRILPRIMVDVSDVDTSTTVLGYRAAMPVMVAPMAMHGLAHPDKEPGTAQGALRQQIPMVVSTMATAALTDVASVSGHPCLVFQLYVIRDRALVATWVAQAEAAGYRAIMITVDAPRLGKREADERNSFQLPPGLQLANLAPLAAKAGGGRTGLLQARDDMAGGGGGRGGGGSGLFQLFAKEVDDTLTWDFLPWLKSITRLPVYVKGVLDPADAQLAVQHGADGVVVSNHGGRQLDYAPAALDVLPAVVAAVGGRVPVWCDGGVRRGTDVLKALALGATGVLLGRPLLYALALDGAAGVSRALDLLRRELELAMALAGCRTLRDITPQHLLRVTCGGLQRLQQPPAPAGGGCSGCCSCAAPALLQQQQRQCSGCCSSSCCCCCGAGAGARGDAASQCCGGGGSGSCSGCGHHHHRPRDAAPARRHDGQQPLQLQAAASRPPPVSKL